ncbi:MAG: YjjG family noncanonical pyrimidine nucleotidase [Anaeroplasmataceae bacterium]
MRFNITSTRDYDYMELAKKLGVFKPDLKSENLVVMYSDEDDPVGYGYFQQLDTKKVALKEIIMDESINNSDNYYEIYKALENYAFQKGYETIIDEIKGTKVSLEKKYKVILIDLDDTLFDFKLSEKKAFFATMKKFKVKVTEGHALKFSEINEEFFQKFASGEMTRLEFQEARFYEFFDFLGVEKDPAKANKYFLNDLSERADLYDYTLKLVKKLSEKYKLCAVTNGMASVQLQRIKASKLDKYFRKVYVSSQIGYNKPKKEFFDYIFNDLKYNKKSEFLIIGDREESDMQGGINAQIDTCYYNKTKKNANKVYTFDVRELPDILLKI